MEDREEEKSRCKKCNAIIDKKYDYCKICNDEENKEIAVMNKHPDNFRKTIDFYKIKLVDMFNHPKKKKIILTFTKNNAYIADIVITETNFFYIQHRRTIVKKKLPNSQIEIEVIEAPLELISAVSILKNDREMRKLRWYD